MKRLEKLAVRLGLGIVKHRKFALPVIVTACIVLVATLIIGSYKIADFQADKEIDFWKSVAIEAEPEVCSLCEYGEAMTYHAPALVNLSTGEVGEMRVYKSEMVGDTLEVATIQQTGTFAFVKCAGLTGQQDTCSHTFRVEIPKELETMEMRNFCHSCRSMLAETAKEGVVIADLFDLENIKIYAIKEKTECMVRDYKISMYWDTYLDELIVEVQGQTDGLIFVD